MLDFLNKLLQGGKKDPGSQLTYGERRALYTAILPLMELRTPGMIKRSVKERREFAKSLHRQIEETLVKSIKDFDDRSMLMKAAEVAIRAAKADLLSKIDQGKERAFHKQDYVEAIVRLRLQEQGVDDPKELDHVINTFIPGFYGMVELQSERKGISLDAAIEEALTCMEINVSKGIETPEGTFKHVNPEEVARLKGNQMN